MINITARAVGIWFGLGHFAIYDEGLWTEFSQRCPEVSADSLR